jgi:hypothetical protein
LRPLMMSFVCGYTESNFRGCEGTTTRVSRWVKDCAHDPRLVTSSIENRVEP